MSYIYRLALPKFVVSSCGDEFFLPDDPQFYWQTLPGKDSIFSLFTWVHVSFFSSFFYACSFPCNTFFFFVFVNFLHREHMSLIMYICHSGQRHMRLVPNAEHSMAGHATDVMYVNVFLILVSSYLLKLIFVSSISISAWMIQVAKNFTVPQMR